MSATAADIVFVIDSSESMSPCIDGVRKNISAFLGELDAGPARDWDVRYDFVAHSAGPNTFRGRSTFKTSTLGLAQALYLPSAGQHGGREPEFFGQSVDAFRQALGSVEATGDEASLVALDFALDFPWRPKRNTHRFVVLLTDEPLSAGQFAEESQRLLPRMIEKLHTLKVMLFLVTPNCSLFEELSAADKCEWEVVPGGDGLAGIDFHRLLKAMAKSLSKSQTPLGAPPPTAQRALFGQDLWSPGGTISGR